MMNYHKIGQNIKKRRKAHGLSQEELAEKVDISTTHMSHIETGNTKLSLPVLVALSQALNVGTDELLGRRNPDVTHSAAGEISAILESCSTQQIKIIVALVKAAKDSMDKYL